MFYGNEEPVSIREFLSQKPLWMWIVIFLLVLFGLAFGCFGIYQLVITNEQEIITSNDIQSQVCEQSADFGQITVYISGAVTNPGVYILETGDRIADLLKTAGGISKAADTVFVNKQFNLAKRLEDGEQVYIPTREEAEAQLSAQSSFINEDKKTETITTEINYPISINSSPKSVLMQLSGIGEVRATKIIENRPYSSVDELVEKMIISQSIFDDNKEKIAL